MLEIMLTSAMSYFVKFSVTGKNGGMSAKKLEKWYYMHFMVSKCSSLRWLSHLLTTKVQFSHVQGVKISFHTKSEEIAQNFACILHMVSTTWY